MPATTKKPTTKAENAHFLKGHASWLYCDDCNKTIGYLCFVTYDYFRFEFTCACGHKGWVENSFKEMDVESLPTGALQLSPKNKRYCCSKDGSALFSPVPKNLKSYKAAVVCKECGTVYTRVEEY